MSSVYIGDSWDSFVPKNHTREISNFYKDFNIYQFLMHNFLYQNVPLFLLYILLTKKLTHFGLRFSGQFDVENQKQKIANILKKLLNYNKFHE